MLDERVLLGLVDLAVMRYLRVAHAGRARANAESGWQDAVRAESQASAAQLRDLLAQARTAKDGASTAPKLADALQQVVLRTLARLRGRAWGQGLDVRAS
jgi:hypothetical protein